MHLTIPKKSLFFILLFCSNIIIAQPSITAKLKKANLYAGIDIGSKGVKLSIIQMSKNATASGAFMTVKDTSINTDFVSFTNSSFTATLKGICDLYNYANVSFGIPSTKIYTVISSGIKGQAEKENKTNLIKNLADSFKLYIKEPLRDVAVIDVITEAKLSHIGIVPESRRYSTFLIDIGSGNTKGGYFKNGNTKDIKLFALTWGTKTIFNATEKRTEDDKSITNFKKQLDRVINGQPEEEIIYAVNESGAYSMNDNFAFSGGIAWSVATLLYPELLENAVVPVSYKEVVNFYDKLSTNFSSIMPDSIANNLIDKSIDKENVAAECKKVLKVFDQKSLMSGTALLLKIMRQFEGTQEKKQFFLVKNGQVGWISAYVSQEINN